eukprot:CAMPEP_0202053890 /NCGR_PEP_ID=MMETSP0963-20130614/6124_1 /ASSEMBLY_ACC=CAM_ASM_000494 /TAXON_ID=4773 /ORGANISM="Schizochytrium aggregatum, Strain ATCC28209" /LENGTH=98 /DNA_ID=CAMNT_0048619263 /DNA_START=208 /DNA_END=505 /DNA_ORIENTATION=-
MATRQARSLQSQFQMLVSQRSPLPGSDDHGQQRERVRGLKEQRRIASRRALLVRDTDHARCRRRLREQSRQRVLLQRLGRSEPPAQQAVMGALARPKL